LFAYPTGYSYRAIKQLFFGLSAPNSVARMSKNLLRMYELCLRSCSPQTWCMLSMLLCFSNLYP